MKKILIVDDEPKNLNAVRRVFTDVDCRMRFAENGALALEAVVKDPPALVILDIMMPEMDGIEACRKIKAASPETMVLLLSALGELPDRMQGYAALADDYLSKPYDSGELLAKARILLRLHEARQKLAHLNQHLEAKVQERTEALIIREQQATASKMIQGIVHNLKGPLSGAFFSAQLSERELEKAIETPEENPPDILRLRTHTRTIKSALKKSFDLVESLLSVGGSNPGEKSQPLDMNDILQKEYRLLRPDMALQHRVDVYLDLAEKLPPLTGKPSDFSQVFYNLMKNACDAMAGSPKKQLHITTRQEEDHLVVTFSDTGTGIDPDRIPNIFKPFYTTKTDQGQGSSGTGLGLFISARLLEPYQGEIKVERRDPVGSIFHVRLPLTPKEGPWS